MSHRTTRDQYGQLVSALAAQVLRHALEAHRQRQCIRTAPFTRALARDAYLREILAAKALCQSLRNNLHPADWRAVFAGLRQLYRARLATEREADAAVTQTRMANLLESERRAIHGFGALCRAA